MESQCWTGAWCSSQCDSSPEAGCKYTRTRLPTSGRSMWNVVRFLPAMLTRWFKFTGSGMRARLLSCCRHEGLQQLVDQNLQQSFPLAGISPWCRRHAYHSRPQTIPGSLSQAAVPSAGSQTDGPPLAQVFNWSTSTNAGAMPRLWEEQRSSEDKYLQSLVFLPSCTSSESLQGTQKAALMVF